MYVSERSDRYWCNAKRLGLICYSSIVTLGFICAVKGLLYGPHDKVKIGIWIGTLCILLPVPGVIYKQWQKAGKSKYVLAARYKFAKYTKRVWCYDYMHDIQTRVMFRGAWLGDMHLSLAYAQWCAVGSRAKDRRMSVEKLERGAYLIGLSVRHFYVATKQAHMFFRQDPRKLNPHSVHYPILSMAITELEKAKLELRRLDALKINYAEFDSELTIGSELLEHYRTMVDDTMHYLQYAIQIQHKLHGEKHQCYIRSGNKAKYHQVTAS